MKRSARPSRQRDRRRAFLIESCDVRGQFVQLDASWKRALSQLDYPPTVRQLLGEALASVALLAGTLKFEGRLSLQFKGSAAMRFIVVQVNSRGELRGLARWNEVPQHASLAAAFGEDAQLNLLIENARSGETWRGIVEMRGEALADAIGHYFANSEQLATELHLAVDEHTAAGMLLQRLPESSGAADEDGWNRATTLAATLEADELLHLDSSTLLTRLYHQDRVRLFDAEPLRFHCECSRQRCDGMLLSLGEAEVQDIVAEQGAVSIDCEFCGERYRYDPVDALALFRATPGAEADSGRSH